MPDNQGSFVTGLTLGLFAGAASYFLLITPQGKKMRQKLEKEWQAAQASGVVPPVGGKPNEISIRSLFGTLKQAVAEAAEQAQTAHHQPRTKKAAKHSSADGRGSAPPKKTDPRFKGV